MLQTVIKCSLLIVKPFHKLNKLLTQFLAKTVTDLLDKIALSNCFSVTLSLPACYPSVFPLGVALAWIPLMYALLKAYIRD